MKKKKNRKFVSARVTHLQGLPLSFNLQSGIFFWKGEGKS